MIFLFIVNRIEKNYNENRQKIFKNLVKKNTVERENYIVSLNKHLKEQEEIFELKKEKAFKKYQGYVSIIYYYYFLIIL